MRKFSFERLPLVSPFSSLTWKNRVVSVRINHSRKFMDRCRKTQVLRAIPTPEAGGIHGQAKLRWNPKNLVVFVDVSPFPKGKNLQVPCVQFSMSKNRFLCQPAPLSSTSASGNPRFFFVTLPKTKNSPLKMDGWNTIVSFWDGLREE